ncbi:hypothetical protein [Clostridium estertheticum]|uniref:hypothetical protein n=1 Tax=Clostridium estertheticum TaxID=238834 RepID=UPI001C0D1B55|nr:hypothetical protein [Clostridium estertheticum]MBU3173355.1 hypothetical protein [Clostridium estertheticum]
MINNSIIINFGNGDIEILSDTSRKGIAKVGFNTLKTPMPDKIGTTERGNVEEKFYECPVLLTFKNANSIDGLIEVLKKVKSKMISQQTK